MHNFSNRQKCPPFCNPSSSTYTFFSCRRNKFSSSFSSSSLSLFLLAFSSPANTATAVGFNSVVASTSPRFNGSAVVAVAAADSIAICSSSPRSPPPSPRRSPPPSIQSTAAAAPPHLPPLLATARRIVPSATAAQAFNGNLKKVLAGSRRIDLEGLRWRVFYAKGQVLGRLASQIAIVVQGKDKPIYAPNRDDGDMCVVINAKEVCVTGRKMTDKFYRWHTGYIGHLKERSLKDQMAKDPTEVIRKAVMRMLPRNKLRDKLRSKKRLGRMEKISKLWEKSAEYGRF